MPLIDDLIDQLGEAKFLSKMDLNKGFYQIHLKEADMPKTAFCTPWGKFQFTRMHFGLRNAPATFQHLMHVVLAGFENFCNAYMEDIIIFSDSWEEHLEHIQLVVEKLRQAGLTAKPSKCCWVVASLSFLGHVVGKGKVSVPECKMKPIREFVKPVIKKDQQSFLGSTGYYRKFIRDYSSRAHSLTEAIKKATPAKIMWSDDMYDAFLYLCRASSDCCMLYIPVSCDKFLLQTDTSGRGIGAILSIIRDGEELHVSFFSKKLKLAETHYSVTEL